jgi:hypothetical protein
MFGTVVQAIRQTFSPRMWKRAALLRDGEKS